MNVPKLVFIVPYKNRPEEKLHFSIYMKYILEDYNENEYEIYYSHQLENKPFSRGGTKNIGFIAVKNKYPEDYKNITFVFNDVDTVPSEKNMLNFITSKGIVKHFFGFNYTLGGIFSITGEDFEICNGFPNLYGWGLEDNAMNDRVIANNIKIDRSVFYLIGSKKIINFTNDIRKLVDNKDPRDYKEKRFIDNLHNINDLDYTIVFNKENVSKKSSNEFMININKFTSLKNPLHKEYYIQDMSKTTKVYLDVLEKQRTREQWSMYKFMGK
tara:strand:+ start:452 stop:1261 length:810 start_codon:yes stop_codon:yes gene_type:complete